MMENTWAVALVKVTDLLSEIKYRADEIAGIRQQLEKFDDVISPLPSGSLPSMGMVNWAKG